jgi:16S rRNA (cytidine1402-2'-O)-methyltransferase
MSVTAANIGTLFIVATPIGNLEDLSARARRVLSEVALVAAEDTRHSAKLLKMIGCATPMLSLHEHNEVHRTDELLARLEQGMDIALISDAGTPLISDPGYNLVNVLTQRGIRVVPVPGACAAIAALCVSGLPTGRFVFEGFLAAKPNKRRERLRELIKEDRTLVFYEAPHRLEETLQDMHMTLGGERTLTICREITKLHESHYHGTLSEMVERVKTDGDMTRGELVLVVEGAPMPEGSGLTLDVDQLLSALLQELPTSQAAKVAAKITGVERSVLYEKAMELKK